MSTRMFVPALEPLNTSTLPSAPGATMTRLATFWPAAKFRFDVAGLGRPWPKTLRNPAARGPTTVTVNATAATPEVGTPARPVTVTGTEDSPPTRALGAPRPTRVSNTRVGVMADR